MVLREFFNSVLCNRPPELITHMLASSTTYMVGLSLTNNIVSDM